MGFLKYLSALLVCVLLLNIQATAALGVGVKSGDWARYSFDYSPEPSTVFPTWVTGGKTEILEVTGAIATIRFVTFKSDGTTENDTVTAHLFSEDFPNEWDWVLIPSNMEVGDSVVFAGSEMKIDGDDTRTYCGAQRSVLFASKYLSGDSWVTIFWDRKTGIMVEALGSARTSSPITKTSQTVNSTQRMVETNMWAVDLWLWLLPTAAIVGIVAVAVALFLRRRAIGRKLTTPNQSA